MQRMRKGNSSSELALNMPAEERQRSDASQFHPSEETASGGLSFGICAASRADEGLGRDKGEQKGKFVPQACHLSGRSSRRRTPCCCCACTS